MDLRQLVDRSSKGSVSPKKQWAHAPFLPTFLLLGFALNVLSAWGRLFSGDADFTGVGLIIPGGLRLKEKEPPISPTRGKENARTVRRVGNAPGSS